MNQNNSRIQDDSTQLSLKSAVRLKLVARKIRSTLIQRSERTYWYIIMPSNRNKLKWDLANVALLIYSAFQIPFALTFQNTSCTISTIDALNLIVDIIFIADCGLSCVTAYTDTESGNVIADPKSVLKHYASSWLLPDLASSIPLDRIICAVGDSGSHYVRFTKMLRWLKIIRLIKMVRMLRRLQDDVSSLASNGARLLRLVLLLILCTHICACLWYGLIDIAGCRIDSALAPSYSSEACGCEGDDCQVGQLAAAGKGGRDGRWSGCKGRRGREASEIARSRDFGYLEADTMHSLSLSLSPSPLSSQEGETEREEERERGRERKREGESEGGEGIPLLIPLR